MKVAETIMLFSLLLYIWPLVVPSICLLWKRKLINRKIYFLFCSVVLGYMLMFGVPLFLLYTLANSFVYEKFLKAVESFATYYWLGLGLFAIMFFISPVISTYFLYKKFKKPTNTSFHPTSQIARHG